MFNEDNVIERIENEFVGETGIYEIDGEGVWIYDWLSEGIYYLDINKHNVEVVVLPEEIHEDETINVVAIKRNRDELVIIPKNLRHNWLIFHLIDRSIQKINPIKLDCLIDSAMRIESNLYLFPPNTNQPIFVVDLTDYKLKLKKQRWFEDNGRTEYFCWGATLCGNAVIAPIYDTNCVLKVENEKIQVIKFSFDVKIMSAYLKEDEIWILPINGDRIHRAGRDGELKNSIEIIEKNTLISASGFNRIIVTDYGVFLFPINNNDIYVCCKGEKLFRRIESISEKPVSSIISSRYYSRFYDSYWGYMVSGYRFCLLPRRYRYAEIDMRKMIIHHYPLKYGVSLSVEKYVDWKMKVIARSGLLFREYSKYMLKEFTKYLTYISHKDVKSNDCNVGNLIYSFCKNRS